MPDMMNNRSLPCQALSFTAGTNVRPPLPTLPGMARKNRSAMDQFVKNVEVVCQARGFDIKEWAKRAGLSYRVLAYYLRKERAPALDTLDDLATAAGLTVPELLTESLTVDMVKQRAVGSLVQNFVAASPKAQAYAQEILERDTSLPKQA